jgi:hypothetical protein
VTSYSLTRSVIQDSHCFAKSRRERLTDKEQQPILETKRTEQEPEKHCPDLTATTRFFWNAFLLKIHLLLPTNVPSCLSKDLLITIAMYTTICRRRESPEGLTCLVTMEDISTDLGNYGTCSLVSSSSQNALSVSPKATHSRLSVVWRPWILFYLCTN